jgi:hypothetical protein
MAINRNIVYEEQPHECTHQTRSLKLPAATGDNTVYTPLDIAHRILYVDEVAFISRGLDALDTEGVDVTCSLVIADDGEDPSAVGATTVGSVVLNQSEDVTIVQMDLSTVDNGDRRLEEDDVLWAKINIDATDDITAEHIAVSYVLRSFPL